MSVRVPTASHRHASSAAEPSCSLWGYNRGSWSRSRLAVRRNSWSTPSSARLNSRKTSRAGAPKRTARKRCGSVRSASASTKASRRSSLAPAHGVTVSKALKLCGIDAQTPRTPARVHVSTMAPRGTSMATATWLGAPPDTSRHQDANRCQTGSIMRDHTLTDTAALVVEDHHLVVLVAPINPHKPLVRDARLLRQTGMVGWTRRFRSSGSPSQPGGLPWSRLSPVRALMAQLPTRDEPRGSRWGASPAQALEAQGAAGTPSGDLHAQVVRIAVQGATSMTPAFPVSNGTGRGC